MRNTLHYSLSYNPAVKLLAYHFLSTQGNNKCHESDIRCVFLQRTYINVGPYQDVNETTMLKSHDISRESRSEIANSSKGEDGESCSRDSGVSDTSS